MPPCLSYLAKPSVRFFYIWATVLFLVMCVTNDFPGFFFKYVSRDFAHDDSAAGSIFGSVSCFYLFVYSLWTLAPFQALIIQGLLMCIGVRLSSEVERCWKYRGRVTSDWESMLTKIDLHTHRHTHTQEFIDSPN